MLEITLPTLLPIFLIIGLGWGLRTWRALPDGFFAGLNSLVFFIGLPALLLVKIATSPLQGGPALRIFWVVLAATVVVTVAAYPLARLLRLDGPGTGSFVQAAMRGNLAYIGLPVVFFALGDLAAASGEIDIETTAMLVLAPTVPLYNLACVIILAQGAGRDGHASRRPSVATLARKVVGNPLLIACLLGLGLALAGVTLPKTVVRTLQPLGQMALPLALLSIGASFCRGGLHRQVGPALVASLLKVVVAPLLGLLVARGLGLSGLETRMALIFLACPTAITGYIMAEQLGADADLASGAIVLSTLLSILPLAVIVACG